MDSVLEDFLSRFGDPNDENIVARKKQTAASTMTAEEAKPFDLKESFKRPAIAGASSINLEEAVPFELEMMSANTSELKPHQPKVESKISAGEIAGKAMDAAPAAIGLLSNIKGNQFDTSIEGGGPGNPTGAVLQGAAQGAQLGSVAGPIGTAAGGLVGGAISLFAGNAAKKKYNKNMKKHNLKENALEKKQNEEDYLMSEGIASLESLKSLRQKQLGLI